jgi:hypothetical protein
MHLIDLPFVDRVSLQVAVEGTASEADTATQVLVSTPKWERLFFHVLSHDSN